MISYEPLWSTMKERGISKYKLTYYWGISSNTLRRMGHGEPISSNTLNELCLILDCRVEDILLFTATEEEITAINERKEEIINFHRKKRKNKPMFPSSREHKACFSLCRFSSVLFLPYYKILYKFFSLLFFQDYRIYILNRDYIHAP